MDINKALAELKDRTAQAAEALIVRPTVTFRMADKGVIEFNKEAMHAMGSHLVRSSSEQDTKVINVYGKNRVATWVSTEGNLIIALTDKETLNGIETSRLTLQGKCKDTLKTNLYHAIMGKDSANTAQEFYLEDVSLDEQFSLAELVPIDAVRESVEESSVEENTDNNPDLAHAIAEALEDEFDTESIAEGIEAVGDYIQANVDAEMVSHQAIPSLPEVPAQ
jgi:hypothetical protein